MKIIPFAEVRALWHPIRQEFIRPGYTYIGIEKERFNLPRSEWYSMEIVPADYRRWLIEQPNLVSRLQKLQGQTLVCSCIDVACHGHELIKMIVASGNGSQRALWSVDQMLRLEFEHLSAGTKKKAKKVKSLQWVSPWIAQGGIYIHTGYGRWEVLPHAHPMTQYWFRRYGEYPVKFALDTNRLSHYLAISS